MSEKKNKVNEDIDKENLEEEIQDGSDEEVTEGDSSEDIKDETQSEESKSAEQTEDANTKYMRLFADFQNYKKRTEKERFERYTDGKKDLATDLLAVLDNFDRAMQHEAEDVTDKQFFDGMQMIFTQLTDVLAKNNIEEIKALGEDFDPNLHHAVVMDASDEYESNKVTEVMQKGYSIQGKVIRPAMVKVSQ